MISKQVIGSQYETAERYLCARAEDVTHDGRDLSIIKMKCNGLIGISSGHKVLKITLRIKISVSFLISLFPLLSCFTSPDTTSDASSSFGYTAHTDTSLNHNFVFKDFFLHHLCRPNRVIFTELPLTSEH